MEDFEKPLIFPSHLYIIYKHMTKFRGLSKASMESGQSNQLSQVYIPANLFHFHLKYCL
jgi:hypothetical protein